MQVYKFFKLCHVCGGDGLRPNLVGGSWEDASCSRCDGFGFYDMGYLEYVVDNIFPAYQVLECLDSTEHNALTDTQKDGVLHILACGFVDLNEGKAGRVRLWNWFGAESTTVANLTALLE